VKKRRERGGQQRIDAGRDYDSSGCRGWKSLGLLLDVRFNTRNRTHPRPHKPPDDFQGVREQHVALLHFRQQTLRGVGRGGAGGVVGIPILFTTSHGRVVANKL
jgi:hypothetical protein